MRSYLLGLMVFTLLIVSGGSSGAQDNRLSQEQLRWLDQVNLAYANMLGLRSYRRSSIQNELITLTSGDQVVYRESEASTDLSVLRSPDGSLRAVKFQRSRSTVTERNGRGALQEVGFALIWLRDGLYLRYDPAPRRFPKGWFLLGDYPDLGLDGEGLLAQTEARTFSNFLPLPENIAWIEQIEPEMLDGQVMFVYEIIWDAAVLLKSGAMLFPWELPAASDPQALNPLYDQYGAISVILQQVWIGADDGRVHRIDFYISAAGGLDFLPGEGAVDFEQESLSSYTFTDFGRPLPISAPPIGE